MTIPLPQPVNVEERYLHAIAIRIDALCDMMSSFLEAYAKEKNLATESHEVIEKPPTKRGKKA